MTIQDSSTNSNELKTEPRRRQNANKQVEVYTVAYLKGDIDLVAYRKKINQVNPRIDLRRIAAKLGFQSEPK